MLKSNPKKRFGQNFLTSGYILDKINQVFNAKLEDDILEIGPGKGALTKVLLAQDINSLSVVEIDRDLINNLEKIKIKYPNKFEVYNTDILEFNFQDLIYNKNLSQNNTKKYRVIGNLPYNISTPLLFKLINNKNVILDIHAMLQKEVADRIVANPGSKSYGRLSIMLQYSCKAEYLFDVGPESFDPPPKVNSSFIRLIPYNNPPYLCKDYILLDKIVAAAFSKRRKTIANGLKEYLNNQDFLNLNIDPKLRAEQLSVKNFVDIANYYIINK